MNYCDIFLQTTSGSVYHLKRNEWYETKTYSDPAKIDQLSQDIISIAPGHTNNYFLTTSGELFMSDKNSPTQVYTPKFSLKLTAIAAADYFMGIATNGRLYIWGKYNEESYSVPS